MFETLAPDPSAEGYVVLCALKMRTDDYGELMTEYDRRYPSTVLTGRIRFENARILFDEGRFGEASLEFSKVPSSSLTDAEMPEYIFKSGYSAFSVGRNPEAQQFFTILDALDHSEFSAPGHYVSGVIYYNDSRFAEAAAVGRVDEHYVERLFFGAYRGGEIRLHHPEPAFDSFEILSYEFDRRPRRIHEHDFARPPRNTLYTERAAPRKKVEHTGVGHTCLQNVEHRFLYSVRGGTHRRIGGRNQFFSTVFSADYSHCISPKKAFTAAFSAVITSFSVTTASSATS